MSDSRSAADQQGGSASSPSPLLASIRGPRDVKNLDPVTLRQLAADIRAHLVDTVAQTGGHLSPNLGVVELTLALHRVFDSPRDLIVWDTGHQAYVHKMLTGRTHRFPSLRQPGGLSGYPSRRESEHDLVENSHASTSLSYALGIAEARLRRGIEGQVVAVIGDGALTGGMAMEALNQIAHLQPSNLTVIVNDNGRSYAPTVGGLAQHLAQLRVHPAYERLKGNVRRSLRSMPVVGRGAEHYAGRVKESFKEFIQDTTYFEKLGLKYTGPVDGHDLGRLEEVLRRAALFDHPVVVHVVTDKGHGYGPAVEEEIDRMHGVGAFDPLTGRQLRTELTYTDVFSQAIVNLGARRPEVVTITAAMGSPTGLLDFGREFPERFFDVGICEQHAVTFAAGLAMAGLRPVVAIYSTFMQRAFDQLMMDVGLHNLPVVFVLDRAGVTGADGASHNGIFDLSYLRLVPNLKVAAPADATELCALLETALNQDGPIAIRFPKGTALENPSLPVEPLPVGRWEEVRRGSELAFLAIGRMVGVAGEAARRLAREGIDAGVVNCRWLKPIDPRLVTDWAVRYPTLITVEDNVRQGGFGAAVLETLAPHGLAGKVRVRALPDRFLEQGSVDAILAEHGLNVEALVAAGRAAAAVRP